MAKLIGTDPNQVPTNADLGTMAYQDSKNTVLENAYINAKGADGLEMGRDYTSPNNSSRLFFNSSVSGGNWTIFNNSGGLRIQSGAEAGSTSGNYTAVALSTTGMVLGGTVQKPNQPAFLAVSASSQTNIPAYTLTNVVFGTEVFDQGGDFSSNTFTAPVTGRYQLSFNIRMNDVDHEAVFLDVRLKTSNRDYQFVFANDDDLESDASFVMAQVSTLADMDAGDTAYINIYQEGGTSQMDLSIGGSCCFSGFLVA